MSSDSITKRAGSFWVQKAMWIHFIYLSFLHMSQKPVGLSFTLVPKQWMGTVQMYGALMQLSLLLKGFRQKKSLLGISPMHWSLIALLISFHQSIVWWKMQIFPSLPETDKLFVWWEGGCVNTDNGNCRNWVCGYGYNILITHLDKFLLKLLFHSSSFAIRSHYLFL